jgi:hypothetical protein
LKYYLQKYRDTTVGDRKKNMDELDGFDKDHWDEGSKL